MPGRSIWKGNFVDAFLLRMKKKRAFLLNRKIGSRKSSILPEFVDCSVRIYNGKTPIRCKITEKRLVNNLESLLLHGNIDFREQILDLEEKGKSSLIAYGMKRKSDFGKTLYES